MGKRRRSPIVAFLALGASLYGLWQLFPELVFAFEGSPENLGGAERPVDAALLRSGLYARVVGVADGTSGTARLGDELREIVPLKDAPLVVLRIAKNEGGPSGGALVEAEGRIRRGDEGKGWSTAAEAVASRRGLATSDVYVLVDGEAPSVPWRAGALSVLLIAVIVLNIVWLLRLRTPL